MHYDVIVIGAGPSGAFAAYKLAGRGARVLILERHRLPREKPCGGGLTPKAYRQIDFPIDDLVVARQHGVWLRGRGVEPFALGDPRAEIWMVQRPAFDQRLAQRAIAAGAELREGEPAVSIEPLHSTGQSPSPDDPAAWRSATGVRVRTAMGVYEATVAIAADGAESPTARQLGLRKGRDGRVVVALEAEVEAVDETLGGRALIDFDVPRGYAWVFPKGRIYNVGLGSFDANSFKTLRRRLGEFVGRSGLRLLTEPKVVGHRIPIGGVAEPLHRGRVALVGDAAGLADGLFAEGIAYALRSGTLAAEEAARVLAGEAQDMSGYTRRLQRTLLRDLRAWRVLGKVIYRVPALSIRLLRRSSRAQRLAAASIAGERSLSKVWHRAGAR